MTTSTICSGLIALLFMPTIALSQTVNLSGKTQSKITAHVTKRDVLTVTDDKGGWFERGLEMQQDWEGFYNLSIAVYPPDGDFRSTAGTYSGVLSMTFEPVDKVP
ncbi:hypothetical protein LH704_18110 [Burkholderia cenocepacia]|uniref:hypothetical protein n=1 Tax=Burkholderia cenocepacia TaxID=95486 RepID=UPI001F47B488|nr:hypothetical protein [Burkholderia cenocepacia]MCF1369855.1 hypothetical protein [Burkholderia cenocepacia]MCF1386114.1 hypothetical protein [Burkholderia cenocepacia]